MEPHAAGRRYVQLQTTVDRRDKAEELMRAAVDARLAACGQILGPISSTYRWRGRVEQAEEWLCLLKTREELSERLAAFLRERHPYEVPEIVTLAIERASEAYGGWIDDETLG